MDEKKKEHPKVLKEPAKLEKKSELKVLTESLFPKDVHGLLSSAIRNAAADMTYDVITNGAAIIADSIANLLDPSGRIIGKGGKSTFSRQRDYTRNFKSGRNNRMRNDNDDDDFRYARRRSMFDYDQLIFRNRGDAESILYAMCDIIDQYGVASVGDLYDLAEVTNDNHMVNKYGWTDLRDARVIHVRKGYTIDFPKPMLLSQGE